MAQDYEMQKILLDKNKFIYYINTTIVVELLQ